VSRIIGIDEAGRGAVLGPLVMVAVSITVEGEAVLEKFGVQDSKKYGSGKRAKMARLAARPAILGRCRMASVSFCAEAVDAYVGKKGLDNLERKGALQLLLDVGATEEDQIICDGQPIFQRLNVNWPNLIAENKADGKYVAVSAASILAKVARDEAMDKICQKYEPEFGKITGGGYVNKGSRGFLTAYEEKYGELPPECRKSWTWREKKKVVETPDLFDLLGD